MSPEHASSQQFSAKKPSSGTTSSPSRRRIEPRTVKTITQADRSDWIKGRIQV